MNAPVAKKPENNGAAKPNVVKPTVDPEKAFKEIRQEIRTLAKTIKDMQQKDDSQAVMVTLPRELYTRLNAFLSDENWSLSEYVIGAIDVCLYSDEEAKLRDTKEKAVQSDKNKYETIHE